MGLKTGPNELPATVAGRPLEAAWSRVLSATRSPRGIVMLAVLPLALFLGVSESGAYLNTYLFYQPAMQMRAALGLAPHLHPSVRLVLAEDRSIEKLGRHPTFADWRQIALHLKALRFERVFLMGIHNLASEIGTLPVEDGGTSDLELDMVLGAVVVEDELNRRSVALEDVQTSSLVPAAGADISNYPVATRALVPVSQAFTKGTVLGHLNILSNFKVPAAYRVGLDRLLPSFGLHAAKGLAWRNDTLVANDGVIPVDGDGNVYVDFVDSSYKTQAVPVAAFFERGHLRTALSDTVREHLAGGTVAVLVPDAFTGSRFLDSPSGKVLSYLAGVSVLNSGLSGRYLSEPISTWPLAVAWAAMLVAIGTGTTRARRVSLATSLVPPFACTALLIGSDFVLPCVQLTLPAVAGWLARMGCHLFSTLSDKVSLNKDLELGRAVQRLLLPKTHTGIVGPWEFTVHYQPYGSMAGDWFQVFFDQTLMGGGIGIIAIGDGVGKGPSAALSTAVIAGVWHLEKERWRHEGINVERLVRAIDESVRATFNGEMFTTLSVAVLHEDSVEISGCASPFWVHLGSDGRHAEGRVIRLLPNDPLGMARDKRDYQHRPKSVPMAEGDVLMAYTDGLIDGLKGLRKFFRMVRTDDFDFNAPDVFDQIRRLATRAGEDDVLPDDCTMLLIRRRRSATNAPSAKAG